MSPASSPASLRSCAPTAQTRAARSSTGRAAHAGCAPCTAPRTSRTASTSDAGYVASGSPVAGSTVVTSGIDGFVGLHAALGQVLEDVAEHVFLEVLRVLVVLVGLRVGVLLVEEEGLRVLRVDLRLVEDVALLGAGQRRHLLDHLGDPLGLSGLGLPGGSDDERHVSCPSGWGCRLCCAGCRSGRL